MATRATSRVRGRKRGNPARPRRRFSEDHPEVILSDLEIQRKITDAFLPRHMREAGEDALNIARQIQQAIARKAPEVQIEGQRDILRDHLQREFPKLFPQRVKNYPRSKYWHTVADADGILSVAYTGTMSGAQAAGKRLVAKGYQAHVMPAEGDEPRGWRKEWKVGLKNPNWGQVLVPMDSITPLHEVRETEWRDKLVSELRANGWVGRPLLVLHTDKGEFRAITGSHRLGALAWMRRKGEWPKNLPSGKVPSLVLEKKDFEKGGWDLIQQAVYDEDRMGVLMRKLKDSLVHPGPNSPAIQIMAEELARDHEGWDQHERVSPEMDKLRDKLDPFDYIGAEVMANPSGRYIFAFFYEDESGNVSPGGSRGFGSVIAAKAYSKLVYLQEGAVHYTIYDQEKGKLVAQKGFRSTTEAGRHAVKNPPGDIQDRFSSQLANALWPRVKGVGSRSELHQEIHQAMHGVSEPGAGAGRVGNPSMWELSSRPEVNAEYQRLFQQYLNDNPVTYKYPARNQLTDADRHARRKLKVWLRKQGIEVERNPAGGDSSASSLFESFHGTPSTSVSTVSEVEEYPDNLATLGQLVELKVNTLSKLEATIQFGGNGDGSGKGNGKGRVGNPTGDIETHQLWYIGPFRTSSSEGADAAGLELQRKGYNVVFVEKSGGKWYIMGKSRKGQPVPPHSVLGNWPRMDRRNPEELDSDAPVLASSPDGRQLYIVGGDQSLDLSALRMSGPKWERDSMVLGVLDEFTYRTKKGFDNFKMSDYYHHAGEESGVQPMLVYDNINRRLSIVGGQYRITPRGVEN